MLRFGWIGTLVAALLVAPLATAEDAFDMARQQRIEASIARLRSYAARAAESTPDAIYIQDVAKFGAAAAEAAPELIELLACPHTEVRHAALAALAAIGRGRRDVQVAVVGVLADHEDASLRSQAATVLGRLDLPADRVVPLLIDALDDPAAMVRATALQGIGAYRVAAVSAVPRVVDLIDDDSTVGIAITLDLARERPLRYEVVSTLGLIGADDARVPPLLLRTMRNDPSGEVRVAAAVAYFRATGDGRAPLDSLSEALCSEELDTRMAALEACPALGDASVRLLPQLVDSLEHQQLEVRWMSAQALGSLGHLAREAVSALRSLAAQDGSELVRDSAMEALERVDGFAPGATSSP